MAKQEEIKEEKQVKSAVVVFRVFQALCLSVFAMGLSMMAGDYAGAINLPFSSLSLGTTIFGLLGSVITEVFAKQAKTW